MIPKNAVDCCFPDTKQLADVTNTIAVEIEENWNTLLEILGDGTCRHGAFTKCCGASASSNSAYFTAGMTFFAIPHRNKKNCNMTRTDPLSACDDLSYIFGTDYA
jgi:hypothetical protein